MRKMHIYLDSLKENIRPQYEIVQDTEDSGIAKVVLNISSQAVEIWLGFEKTSDYVDVSILMAKIEDCQRDSILKVLNELNCKYRNICYLIDESNIVLQRFSYIFNEDYQAAAVLQDLIAVSLRDIVEYDLEKIMRVRWAN